jgi:hypothetical protein
MEESMNPTYHLSPNPTGPDHERKFSEPRTVPGGWDIDPLKQPTEVLPSDMATAYFEEPPSANLPEDGQREGSQDWLPEKFSELRTIPTGWDTSEFK